MFLYGDSLQMTFIFFVLMIMCISYFLLVVKKISEQGKFREGKIHFDL